MYLIKNKRGFSLVEVIVSIAILSVLAFSFVPLFGGSFENIFSYGERDKTSSYVSDIFESLYAEQPYSLESKDDIIEDLEYFGGKNSSDNGLHQYDPEYDYESDYDFNFSIETIKPGDEFANEGYKVTIVAFYRDGEHSVELSTFIRGESDE